MWNSQAVSIPSRVCAGLDVDHARRSEIRPGELLLAGPDELDGPAGLAGQSRGLDGRLARVLAAVAGAGVGHDHPHAVVRHPEGRGQLAAHAERALRAGPDGQLAVLPLRHRGAGLERGVGDVRDRIGLLEPDVGGFQSLGDRPGVRVRPAAPAAAFPPRPPRSGGCWPPGCFSSRNRSLSEIAGPGFHSALIAARARAA